VLIDVVGGGTKLLLNNMRWELVLDHSRAMLLAPRSRSTAGVRLAEWVPPVGGALSRHTSTWEVHATGVHRRGRVVPRSKQPRRCQAAEEVRGPPSGRAQEGQR
jgi:hypothetical protein